MLPLLTPTKTAERVTFRLNTEIVSAEEAIKLANVWLLFHVGNLLLAENPELRFLPTRNQLHWQVEVWLTRPSIGRVAQIGTLNINAQTGEPLPAPTLIETLQQRATHATVH